MKDNGPTVTIDALLISFGNGKRRNVKVQVAVEAPVSIYLNREKLVTLFATPVMLKELAIGHLLAEGIAKLVEEVSTTNVRRNNIHITTSRSLEARIIVYGHQADITSECASTGDFRRLLERVDTPRVTTDYRVSISEIRSMVELLGAASSKSKLGAALHSSAIFKGGRMVAFAEDVSRYSSTDKVIGAAALQKIDFGRSVLLGTGRQPASMVLKAARVGIPISISIRGPIESGIYAARRLGVTLACLQRGELGVFSNSERVMN